MPTIANEMSSPLIEDARRSLPNVPRFFPFGCEESDDSKDESAGDNQRANNSKRKHRTSTFAEGVATEQVGHNADSGCEQAEQSCLGDQRARLRWRSHGAGLLGQAPSYQRGKIGPATRTRLEVLISLPGIAPWHIGHETGSTITVQISAADMPDFEPGNRVETTGPGGRFNPPEPIEKGQAFWPGLFLITTEGY